MYRCFLDLDGVLADFVAGICRAHGRRSPYLQPGSPRGPHAWDLGGILRLTPKEFYAPCDRRFWANLPLTPESGRIESLVRGRFGERVAILTSPVSQDGCGDGKRDWVRRHYPKLEKRLLIGSCKEFCAGPLAVLIDDNQGNVDTWRAAGGIAFLVPRPWNDHWQREPQLVEDLGRFLDPLD